MTLALPLRSDPQPSVIGELRARLSAARATLPRPRDGLRFQVRELVLLGTASRGGSSLVAEVLRRSRHFLHLRGELNPLLVLSGQCFPSSGTGSDALGSAALSDAAGVQTLDEDLAFECGEPSSSLSTEEELWRFCVDLSSRLWMQWPGLGISLEDVRRCMHDALRALVHSRGWRPGQFEDSQLFHAVFLQRLRRAYPEINPHYYDLRPELLARYHPDVAPADGPPGEVLVEEPPFITVGPWKPADEEALATRALLIKTPSNAYRVDYLRALFPSAAMRLLHLTRNVAASVNGLLDGWQHRGFFSHRVPCRLAIGGYSDRFAGFGQHWWKFDLPPRWQSMVTARLEEVCLFQWMSAHEALLRAIRSGGVGHLRIRFEDIIGPPLLRRTVFDTVMQWSGGKLDEPLLQCVLDPPVVMATKRPAKRRWLERMPLLNPLLQRPDVQATMHALGYEEDPSQWP